MFWNKEKIKKQAEPDKKEDAEKAAPVVIKEEKDTSPKALRELLEKNLKWSQIIYEQNRKINRKLFWYDLAGWLRLLVIVAPIILAIIFLPPLIKDYWNKYGSLLGGLSGKPAGVPAMNPSSIEQLLKLLPIDAAQQQQLKAILK